MLAIAPKSYGESGIEDGTIALTTFELVAQSKGFGTFWCGFFKRACQSNPEIAKIIGLPEDLIIVEAMGFGVGDVDWKRPAARQAVTGIKFIE